LLRTYCTMVTLYFTTLLASSILRAMRLTVELMRAKPARPRIFNFVSAKINTIQTGKRKAHKILGTVLYKLTVTKKHPRNEITLTKK
jgi:hypothetical protein